MKVNILIIAYLFICSAVSAQKTHNWKLDSYQFNAGGVMSTKIPAASYGTYENIINTSIAQPIDQYDISWSEPKSLTNLRMKPICNLNVQLFNTKTSSIQRFGLSLNSRMLSSFLTRYDMVIYATPDTFGLPVYYTGDLRLNHTTPVLTLDYAYLKQLKVSKQLNFNFGAGAYAGISLLNKVEAVATREFNGAVQNVGRVLISDLHGSEWLSNFSKHNFNAGIYASFGLEYSLHDKQVENQRWYLTFENRICYDFFAVKNVPSSWFSFQSAQMFGLKYYLNRR